MSWTLRRRSLLAGSALAVTTSRHAVAQGAAWPAQPIRLVVPFAPGGTTDLVARLLAAGLQERLGVSVVVENRAGAGATVGSEMVARAAPDGYTLVMSNIASHGISPSVYRGRIRYDRLRAYRAGGDEPDRVGGEPARGHPHAGGCGGEGARGGRA
jgi:tripartite-type tricarboxylate transporter receptor subunit TctC